MSITRLEAAEEIQAGEMKQTGGSIASLRIEGLADADSMRIFDAARRRGGY